MIVVLPNVSGGIGATHNLDHGMAWTPEDVGQHPSHRKRPKGRPRRAELRKGQDAGPTIAEASARESAALHAEPTRIEECARWGDQEVGKMIRLFRAGAMVEDIAIAIGESVQVVTYELRRIRVDLVARAEGRVLEPSRGGGANGRRLSDDQVARIVAMRREGATVGAISREMGVADSTVRYIVEREGGD